MNRTILLTGAILGFLAVLLGAFGAHGLEKLVDDGAVRTFKTGVTYQMYHALFLLILGGIVQLPDKSKKGVFYLITIGIFLFSFSIYLLATNTLTAFDFRILGPVTPLGGGLLILGWMVLGYRIFKQLG